MLGYFARLHVAGRVSGAGLPVQPTRHRMRAPDRRESDTKVSHATQERAPRRRMLSRSPVSDGRGSRPRRALSADCASLAATRSSERNSAATTRAPASQAADFKNCCMLSGEFDGSDRDHFFQRVTVASNNHWMGAVRPPPSAAAFRESLGYVQVAR